ncbi:MAG: DNA polymerase Y family protein [Pseudomonadota bacterium]|nr:DNA polymerase Y family protein [Pseudomonadota bacterium]
MNPLQQQLFDLPAPAPVAPPASAPGSAPVRLYEAPAPQARVVTAPARELWAALQCDAWMNTSVPADLLRVAQGFTPRVAVESSDALLLELAGSQRLFGGLTGLLQALRAAFPRPLRLALAPTPLAAVLLARAGANCCILDPSRLKGRLAPLSLQHLRWPDDELQRLASMGVHTLAELLRLPRAGLARRIGPERLWQLDRLTGTRADPRTALPMPQPFHERVDPGHETLDRERLLAALQPTLERLEIFLRERQRGVMALRLTLEHRRAPPLQCVLRCVVPEYRAARFTALLAARLERIALAEPVRSMAFTAGRPRRFPAASLPLWAAGEQGGAATATQVPEFLQTLMARLGEQAVYGMAEIDEHRPECQQQRHWPVLATPGKARHEALSAPPTGVARPLTLLEQPQPLQALRDAAGHVRTLRHAGRELALLSGPERIESGWWDGRAIARDYYVARASDGARWWIFRECEPPRRWFLHGCFA